MQPNTDDGSDRALNVPSRDNQNLHSAPQRDAAANIVRGHIDQIYTTNPPNQPEQPHQFDSSHAIAENPYDRTHDSAKSAATWQQYHNAWQNYYQQYYQRYYVSQVHAHRQNITAELAKQEASRNMQQLGTPATVTGGSEKESPNTQADLIKKEIRDKVAHRAKKLRHSSHFLPIISALAIGIIFLSLQYNKLIMAQVLAYVSPGSSTSQEVILDPTTNTKVSAESLLTIPKINLSAPVIYGLRSLDNDTVQIALRDGVVQYPIPGADSVPGQMGNTVILGHSSNDVFAPGNYKFAFLILDRLEKGDTFYVNYKSTRYTYSVTGKEVIDPSEINKLVIKTDKPIVSLVTCVPVGTARQRLIVSAEQVSPDPATAIAAPTTPKTNKSFEIPGNTKSFLEQAFGG